MALNFIDTHAHLYADEFDEDLEAVIMRARENEISTILLPNIDRSSVEALHRVADEYPDICLPMMGLHPCSVKQETYKEELQEILEVLNNPQRKYFAVGEIGMDLYWDQTTRDAQEEAFRMQCTWAVERDLPIAIHSRNATLNLLDILDEMKLEELRGVFHCFGDGLPEAQRIIDMGFYLGIGGVLTFKNSGLAEVLKHVSLAHVILETDAPYLAPTPFRGKRNESSYLMQVAQKLAEAKGVSLKQIADITSSNARELFRIP